MKLVLVAAAALAPASAIATTEKPVWFWFEDCGAKSMRIEVALDGEKIFHVSFPICSRLRAPEQSAEQRILQYWFTPKREIAWAGYLDEDNVSPAGLKLEGNIWQAGADEDALILGLTFDTGDRIYMNTLCIAPIARAERSEIEPGLIVHTFPMAANAESESE